MKSIKRLSKDAIKEIQDYLDGVYDNFADDRTHKVWTFKFGDGREIDIRLEATVEDFYLNIVLYDSEGRELSFAEPEYEFIGEHYFEYDGRIYIAEISEDIVDYKKTIKDLENDKLIQKYLYKGTWISGSSTVVYPITEWDRDIEIQLSTTKNVFNKFIQRFINSHKDTIEDGWFNHKDGSCPCSITFIKKIY